MAIANVALVSLEAIPPLLYNAIILQVSARVLIIKVWLAQPGVLYRNRAQTKRSSDRPESSSGVLKSHFWATNVTRRLSLWGSPQ